MRHKGVLICHPSREQEVIDMVTASGQEELFDVRPSEYAPLDKVYVRSYEALRWGRDQ